MEEILIIIIVLIIVFAAVFALVVKRHSISKFIAPKIGGVLPTVSEVNDLLHKFDVFVKNDMLNYDTNAAIQNLERKSSDLSDSFVDLFLEYIRNDDFVGAKDLKDKLSTIYSSNEYFLGNLALDSADNIFINRINDIKSNIENIENITKIDEIDRINTLEEKYNILCNDLMSINNNRDIMWFPEEQMIKLRTASKENAMKQAADAGRSAEKIAQEGEHAYRNKKDPRVDYFKSFALVSYLKFVQDVLDDKLTGAVNDAPGMLQQYSDLIRNHIVAKQTALFSSAKALKDCIDDLVKYITEFNKITIVFDSDTNYVRMVRPIINNGGTPDNIYLNLAKIRSRMNDFTKKLEELQTAIDTINLKINGVVGFDLKYIDVLETKVAGYINGCKDTVDIVDALEAKVDTNSKPQNAPTMDDKAKDIIGKLTNLFNDNSTKIEAALKTGLDQNTHYNIGINSENIDKLIMQLSDVILNANNISDDIKNKLNEFENERMITNMKLLRLFTIKLKKVTEELGATNDTVATSRLEFTSGLLKNNIAKIMSSMGRTKETVLQTRQEKARIQQEKDDKAAEEAEKQRIEIMAKKAIEQYEKEKKEKAEKMNKTTAAEKKFLADNEQKFSAAEHTRSFADELGDIPKKNSESCTIPTVDFKQFWDTNIASESGALIVSTFFKDYPVVLYNAYKSPTVDNLLVLDKYTRQMDSGLSIINDYIVNTTSNMKPNDYQRYNVRIIHNFLKSSVDIYTDEYTPSIKVARMMKDLKIKKMIQEYSTYNPDDINEKYGKIKIMADDMKRSKINGPMGRHMISYISNSLMSKLSEINLELYNGIYNRLAGYESFIQYVDDNSIRDLVVGEDRIMSTDYAHILPKIGHTPKLNKRNLGYAIIAELEQAMDGITEAAKNISYIRNDIEKINRKATQFIITTKANPGAAPTNSYLDMNLKININDIDPGTFTRVTSHAKHVAFVAYCEMFKDLVSVIELAKSAPSARTYMILGRYMKYITSTLNNPTKPDHASLSEFMSGVIPENVSVKYADFYKVLMNYIADINRLPLKDTSIMFYNTLSCFARNNEYDIKNVSELCKKFKHNFDTSKLNTSRMIFPSDITDARNDIENMLRAHVANKNHPVSGLGNNRLKTCIANLITVEPLLQAAKVTTANGPWVEPVIKFRVHGSDKLFDLPQIGIEPRPPIKVDQNDFGNYINNILDEIQIIKNDSATIAECEQFIGELADRIKRINVDLVENVHRALNGNIINDQDDDYISDEYERLLRIKKNAKSKQKIEDDEYDARLNDMAMVPSETLYDRIGRMPNESTNFIHFVMAKRIAAHTGDKSYDVNVAEMNNPSIIREKLVRFFTSQGIAGVNVNNINEKYAEWQRKSQFRLVHQSDIDDPSATMLQFS